MRRWAKIAITAAALPVVAVPLWSMAQETSSSDGWLVASAEVSASLPLAQPAFVWVERLRQPDAPIAAIVVEAEDGSRRVFEDGVLAAGNYRFFPGERADAGTWFRVRAEPVVDIAATDGGAFAVAPNQPFRVSAHEAPVRIEVTLPEAGLVRLQPVAGNVPAVPDWLDSEGTVIASGAEIRAYGPDRLSIVFPPDAGETTALVRFASDRDLFEPNDVPELAAEVETGLWYQVGSGPGDVDWFKLDLPEGVRLGLSTRGLVGGQAPGVLLSDGSEPAGWPLQTEGGEAVVGLSQGNVPAYEPYLVRFDAISIPETVSAGDILRLTAGARPASYDFTLDVAENSRIDAVAQGVPPGASLNWYLLEDDETVPATSANTVYVAPGEYDVRVDVGATPSPSAFGMAFMVRPSGEEPNDTREQAVDIEIPATLATVFGAAGDTDWYRFTVPEDGVLRIRQGEDAIRSARSLRLALFRVKDDASIGWYHNDPELLDATFGVTAGQYLLSMTSDRRFRDPVALEVAMIDPNAEPADVSGALGVTIVGFGVTPGDGNWMETLGYDTGTNFLPADSTDDLGTALSQSLEETEAQIEPGWGYGTWLLWFALALAAGGAAWWFYGRGYLASRRSAATTKAENTAPEEPATGGDT